MLEVAELNLSISLFSCVAMSCTSNAKQPTGDSGNIIPKYLSCLVERFSYNLSCLVERFSYNLSCQEERYSNNPTCRAECYSYNLICQVQPTVTT